MTPRRVKILYQTRMTVATTKLLLSIGVKRVNDCLKNQKGSTMIRCSLVASNHLTSGNALMATLS